MKEKWSSQILSTNSADHIGLYRCFTRSDLLLEQMLPWISVTTIAVITFQKVLSNFTINLLKCYSVFNRIKEELLKNRNQLCLRLLPHYEGIKWYLIKMLRSFKPTLNVFLGNSYFRY